MTAQTAPARGADRPRLSSSDQIVRDIVRGLYDGRFAAGQRLIEPDMMRLYAVSRGTVREALKRLAAEGVVSITAFRGAQIRHLSLAEATEILQLLEVTIGLAARLAAQNMAGSASRENFGAAYAHLASFADKEDSFDHVQARNRFYRAMTRAAGNRALARLIPSFQVHLIRTYLRRPAKERFADYRAMADAILSGDGDRAEAAGRHHLRHVIQALDAAPESIFAPAVSRQTDGMDDEEIDHD
ncbi:GntR family transcriptional regulator [Allomesorhizobium camelthorni]|uniref:GntR family transcriptional regulator n=1 Tax=Allomesorhizobium camelthorni TaxID=475069 RepID=A0A6G4WH94_9HYPH|nr:GntR family transcriptional regulator [Mesorhizobium camelthorni]NGO53738.1 GntR family transcriptional regulator [Mesorhizobium camelthorni]